LLSVYLTRERTQLLRGKSKKNKSLTITSATELNFGLNSDFADVFEQVADKASAYEDVYIVLPDTEFDLIDCISVAVSTDEINAAIEEKTGLSCDNLYIVQPVEATPGELRKKTVYAIKKSLIDELTAAAEAAGIIIVSIEPASIAFLRSLQSWNKESILLEMFKKEAAIVSYSPIGGIFKMSMESLSENSLLNLHEKSEDEIAASIAQYDFTAQQTFEFINEDVPFNVLTENKQVLEIKPLKKRLAKRARFPAFIKSDIPSESQCDWLIAAGALIEKNSIQSEFYATLPASVNLSSANLLPDEQQREAKLRSWKQSAERMCKILILVMSLISIIEIMGIWVYGGAEIPPVLQKDYDAAYADEKKINAEIAAIKKAKQEHVYPMEAFKGLVKNRPDGCHFGALEVGSKNGRSDDIWIKLTAEAKEALVLQDYIAALRNDMMFSNVNITKINGDTGSGYKTAEITVGKGVMR
jgi:hypothetical protein